MNCFESALVNIIVRNSSAVAVERGGVYGATSRYWLDGLYGVTPHQQFHPD